MTSTNPAPEQAVSLILKTATRGRVRTPTQRREALLDEFEKSGLSGAKFAALSRIKCQTFANWVQQRRRKGQAGALSSAKGAAKSESVSWLEAVVQEDPIGVFLPTAVPFVVLKPNTVVERRQTSVKVMFT